jgi:hypothetical protein
LQLRTITFLGRKKGLAGFGSPPSARRQDKAEISFLETNATTKSERMPIPTPLADIQNLAIGSDGVEPSAFPAATKQADGLVSGIQTDVSSVYFTDKILITISQGGRLSQWVYLRPVSQFTSQY